MKLDFKEDSVVEPPNDQNPHRKKIDRWGGSDSELNSGVHQRRTCFCSGSGSRCRTDPFLSLRAEVELNLSRARAWLSVHKATPPPAYLLCSCPLIILSPRSDPRTEASGRPGSGTPPPLTQPRVPERASWMQLFDSASQR